MEENLNDSKKAEDFLAKEQNKSEEILRAGPKAEEKLSKKIKEEKKEVKIIEKERKNLKKVEKKIEKEIKKDEEMAIDFSGIKNFFKPKKKEAAERKEKASSEEFSFDFQSVGRFIFKYKVVFLILIAIFFAAFIRMQSSQLSFTDSWASSTVDNYYKNQILNQINQQYPNLPDTNKQTLLDQQYSKYITSNAQLIAQQKTELSSQFKGYFRFDSDNKNYMPDIDPYAFLRYTENYLKYGHIGDEERVVNGTTIQWDTHQTAPLGVQTPAKTLHPYMLAYLYQFIKIFDPSTTPMDSAAYFPVIFAALSVIPAFFIGRKIGGNVGGFFAAFIVAIHPAFMGRSLWGHADTDAYNIFFPLFIVWMFLAALENKDRTKRIIYSSIAGILVGIYSLAWDGWWYVFDFIVGMLILYLIYLYIKERKFSENSKNTLLVFIIFIVISGIFVSLIGQGGFPSFINAPFEPISFSKLKIAAHATLWPNVYTTVAELNPASLDQIVGSIGGSLLFILSIVGIGLLFIKKEKDIQIPAMILLILWYIGIFYASVKGVRFTMMLVPPFAIAFGAFAGRIYDWVTGYVKKDMRIDKKITAPILIAVFVLLLIGLYNGSVNTANNDVPIINDAWYNSLNKIKMESAPNAIINSWWDFGHHFKYFTDRGVTFDGGSQNTPMAYWIGKTLLTEDQDLAVGILRMLDCGENTAFDNLNKKIDDVSVSVKILDQAVKMDKANAKKYLATKGLSDSESDDVLKYTHCSPPEDYFITSEDMVGKSGVWAHFGSWDFDKADIWVYAKNLPQNEAIDFIVKNANVSKDEAERLYFDVQGITNEGEANSWIAAWPSYAGTSNCVNIENETVKCNNGVIINLTTYEVMVPTQQGVASPNSIVYLTAEGLVEKKFNSTIGVSMALINANTTTPQIVLMQPELAMSMFTRLYYFEGAGLDHFGLFSHQSGLTGTNIYVWKVNW